MLSRIPRLSSFFVLAVMGVSGAYVLGCHTGEPTSPPSAGLDRPVNPPKAQDLGRGHDRTETDVHYGMFIHEGVRNVCSGPSPSFMFDSAKGSKSEPTMQTLANCMISGPLKGKNIRLTGHTDPRGSEAYNDKLGLERAERVKKYLVAQGVDGERIQTASLGEDASSADADLWPRDRHVQVELVP
jgi:peptidoglycan-associated lipoprotein